MAKAEPALKAAEAALNTLNKGNLTELKSFGKPPPAVVNVTAAVMVLRAPSSKIPKDRSWNNAKIMMAKVCSDVGGCIPTGLIKGLSSLIVLYTVLYVLATQ